MAIPRNTPDRENRKFVESPTRPEETAVETVISNTSDKPIPVTNAGQINPYHNELLQHLKEIQKLLLITGQTNINLIDGLGSKTKNKINEYNAIKVYDQGIPDVDDPVLQIPRSDYLKDVNDNFDARVDGSTTPIDFFISALPNNDIYISSLSFKIADQNAQLNNFGNIGALTNGFQLVYKNQEIGERILVDELQSNFDIVRLCQGLPAFSQGVESFRASNVIGGSEGYIPVLRFRDNFGLPFGIRLKAGTKDQLILRVRDNVTGVDAFDIFYYATELIN